MSENMTEKEFLKHYNMRDYDPVSLTVDITLLTIKDGELAILLVKRKDHPFKNKWALPGGFVLPDETPDQAVRRELEEETSVIVEKSYVEQLKTYAGPNRDPRGYVVSVAYVALAPISDEPVAGDDAKEAVFVPVKEALGRDLAFDHHQIITDGLARVRDKVEYAPIAPHFLVDKEFTMGELRDVYEIIWDKEISPGNFRRKVLSVEDFIHPTGTYRKSQIRGGRNSELYAMGDAKEIYPPFKR